MIFQAGDLVTVRTRDEILSTLDSQGCCNNLPFMPQMFQHCGQQFRIYKRAHKTCDTVDKTGGRRIEDCVHLDLRCDGKAYGDCQAACLLFWHTSWLIPEKADSSSSQPTGPNSVVCTEDDVWRATKTESLPGSAKVRYRCQATQLPEFSTLLKWYDLRQYWEDYRSGNTTGRFLAGGFMYFFILFIINKSFWRLKLFLIRAYDGFQSARGGVPFPRKAGTIVPGKATPRTSLILQPGDHVRVKSHEEILATLNENNKNRGLRFDAEMVPFCGGTYRIRSRVNQFLDEKTGEMIVLKRPSFILEGVFCGSLYSECRLGCPRSIYAWWREIWLEKIPDSGFSVVPNEGNNP
jgi:hypothetical protein